MTGATGAHWKVDNASTPIDCNDNSTVIPMHICDLNEAIAALRDSEAHRLNDERSA